MDHDARAEGHRVVNSPALVVRSALDRLRGSAKLRRPDGRSFYTSLLVADVDLASRSVTVQPPLTASCHEPDGVHAILWNGDVPVGEVTVPGLPEAVLPGLPDIAAGLLHTSGRGHRLPAPWPSQRAVRSADEGGTGAQRPSGSDAKDVTIAVCTRDRPEYLRDCLAAISLLNASVAEVLVVDNASRDDRTREVAHSFPFVRYVREPRQGLDWARNRALVEAKTRIIAYTDDDVLVHPGWVDGILRAYAEEPSAVAVTGLIIPAELSTPAQIYFEGRGGFGRGFERRCFLGKTAEAGAPIDVGLGAAGSGANMALLRDAALELGGFDVALDVGTPSGGGGDLEMFLRVVSAGHLLVYEPTAVVRHRHRRTMEELARQKRGDGTGNYSILLGASHRYDQEVRSRLRRLALWWLIQQYGRRVVCSIIWPALWPPRLVYSDLRGVLDATLGRYYAKGIAQADQQVERHPGEPPGPRPRGRFGAASANVGRVRRNR
ncbi:glycosyltransferase family 2 protein [Geodermatophilus sp. SYSU D00710]